MHKSNESYVVTGGGGFLGRALCDRLVGLGCTVTSIARGDYPELREMGVKTVQADIAAEYEKVRDAIRGARCVFHPAAKVEMWGPYDQFFKVNVVGTRNIIQACRETGVRHLVFTSSPSVVAAGNDLCGVDETVPYPEKFHAAYPETKAIAEKEVMNANDSSLHTICLRPHLIYGPGDTSLEALVVKRAKQGRLVRIGTGENLADFSYIEDCVSAHILAAEALESNPQCRGKVYFISQGKPVKLWDWIDAALRRNGLPPVKRSVPKSVACFVGSILETVARILPIDPPFTRFLAEEMATSHYFNIDAARRDLGFEPKKQDLLNW